MKALSPQAIALMAAWNDMTSTMSIRANMIKQADTVLEYELKHNMGCGCDLYSMSTLPEEQHGWSEFAYSHLFNDGAFYPFQDVETARCAAYMECISEHGNEDDEDALISCYWVVALTEADPVKYMPLIRKIMDIQVNGL